VRLTFGIILASFGFCAVHRPPQAFFGAFFTPFILTRKVFALNRREKAQKAQEQNRGGLA